MKWFSTALITLAATVSLSLAQPTDVSATSEELAERSAVQLTGRRVAVVTGIIFNQILRDCFENNGMLMAQGWAGALYDQWTFSKIPGTLLNIEALVSTKELTNQYCFTVDAVFYFADIKDAQRFATWAANAIGVTRRDEKAIEDGSTMGVFINGIDLPMDHRYFGTNGTGPVDLPITNDSPMSLTKRGGLGRCQNMCGISYTSYQTNICLDSEFPAGNEVFC